MHTETDTVGEAALAFLLRPSGSPTHVDKSAGRALEVARIFGDEVVDIRWFQRNETVRLGLADDFPVPVDLLPGDHHPFLEHDGTAWVVRTGAQWAGFVDEDDRRTALSERLGRDGSLRLGEEETLVVEVGASIFVVRTVWRSAKLPVPLVGEVDPVAVLVTMGMSAVAVMLGVIGAMTPPPSTAEMGSALPSILVDLQLPKPAEPVALKSDAPSEVGGGSSEGPRNPKPSLEKQPGKSDAEVVRDRMDQLFGGLDGVLSETAMNADMRQGIEGLIASKGTQAMGVDGLGSGRCLGHDCIGVGFAEGTGIGDDLGARHRTSAQQLATDMVRGDPPAFRVAVEDPILMGGIDKSAIDAVIKRHMSQIRYCYQRELTKTPSLSGKISVKFIIAKDGSVSSSTVANSSMGSPAVESCVTGRFLRMQFPELRGGGIAVVKYPFVFAQS